MPNETPREELNRLLREALDGDDSVYQSGIDSLVQKWIEKNATDSETAMRLEDIVSVLRSAGPEGISVAQWKAKVRDELHHDAPAIEFQKVAKEFGQKLDNGNYKVKFNRDEDHAAAGVSINALKIVEDFLKGAGRPITMQEWISGVSRQLGAYAGIFVEQFLSTFRGMVTVANGTYAYKEYVPTPPKPPEPEANV